MKKLRDYLELIRFPNLFTAMADITAGAWIAYGSGGDFSAAKLICLLFSSAFLYAMGIIMNDYADFELDQAERPERPLPSGRITRQSALTLGVILGVWGIVLAALVNGVSAVLACAIALFVILYDFCFKPHEILGPIAMGICRGLNLLLGVSLVADSLHQVFWISLIGFVYISTVTAMAKGEVGSGLHPRRARAMVLAILIGAVLLLLIDGGHLFEKVLAVIGYLIWTIRAILPSLREPNAANIRRAVGGCLVGLPLLDAAIAASYGGGTAWLSVAVFMGISLVFKRFFSMT
ncbi:UbiA-like protein EboC [Brevibacillus brevis]|uniref:UbiA-like protein EboC n=1 Tax=Brevibacillus brevis TaxID=1393 RepID=A0ABY9SYR8_BREBE|nr:UbiA-like protein EboC [Brevibacillus brevis]WNC12961.1 UbiA-like protein EboC [Brevibacillus brevis]